VDGLNSFFTILASSDVEVVVFALDIVLKSALLFLVFLFGLRLMGTKLTQGFKHRLWLALVIILVLQPFLPALAGFFFETPTNFALITFLVDGLEEPVSSVLAGNSLVFSSATKIYLLVLAILLSKMLLDLWSLGKLSKSATYDSDLRAAMLNTDLEWPQRLQSELRIGESDKIQSPISFAPGKPTILLPVSWRSWQHAAMRATLSHEIAHIKRRDWIITLAGNFLVCLHWFNPFFWLVKNRMQQASEYACDEFVIQHGLDRAEYADQLLVLSKERKGLVPAYSLVNSIVETGELTQRIEAIIDYPENSSSPTLTHKAILAAITCLLLSLSCVRILTVMNSDAYKEPVLLNSPQPVYAPSVIQHGLQGFARLVFDIDEMGNVDPSSIRIASSNDPYLFALPAIEAVKQFKYSPKTVYGVPKITRGVQHTFRINGLEAKFYSAN